MFGTYAVAVLAALLVVGSLSDHVGRRPVLVAATLLQAVSMAMFATAGGVGALLAARVVQGLATGAAAGAVGAGMLDIDRARGTIANSVSPMLGSAAGGLLSGLMVQYLPAPTTLVYLVLGAIFIAQAIGAAFMTESITPRPGALASLRPHFALPAKVRAPLAAASPVLVAAWALAGFYGSLGPALLRHIAGSSSLLLGGVALFVLAGSGALTVLVTRAWSPRSVTALAAGALIAGVAITLLAIPAASLVVFFLGAVLAGAGFGGGFQGAFRSVLPLAEPHQRAGVLSIVYVLAYLALGVPAVLGGVRFAHGGGIVATAQEYGAAVMILAALALAGALWQPLRDRPAARIRRIMRLARRVEPIATAHVVRASDKRIHRL